jgi:hypothetical protein
MSQHEPGHYAIVRRPDVLDADMRPAEIVNALARLRFNGDSVRSIMLDEGVRDFLLDALTARCGKA